MDPPRLEVKLENETVWLTWCGQMVELFQTTKQNVSLHIQNIRGGGIDGAFSCQGILDYCRRREELRDKVLQSGCHHLGRLPRNRCVGTHPRSRTQRLREFIVKGFTMDDEKLKQGGGAYRADQMENPEVLAKKAATLEWCKHATEHAKEHGGKTWRYLLIPPRCHYWKHDAGGAGFPLIVA